MHYFTSSLTRFKSLNLLIGSIHLLHYTLINFGSDSKPKHFCVYHPTDLISSQGYFCPCTSIKPALEEYEYFIFHLRKETNILFKHVNKETYAIFNRAINLDNEELLDSNLYEFVGQMKEKAINRFLEARKTYILKNFNLDN